MLSLEGKALEDRLWNQAHNNHDVTPESRRVENVTRMAFKTADDVARPCVDRRRACCLATHRSLVCVRVRALQCLEQSFVLLGQHLRWIRESISRSQDSPEKKR